MIVRIYAGSDGESHFELIEPAFEQQGRIERSPLQRTSGIEFVRFPVGFSTEWHHAPRRQYVLSIAGVMEVAIGDGTVRTFGPGDVLLAEDLSGRGHTMRVVGGEPVIHAWIPQPE